ncbi:O-acetylhomoserine aminocarboxypropyltransferase/cysteine synthase family protein [Oceanicella sp. SM1341]|uniref:O-acetylhomoserine aminocarboxypropyltransferase/cysteine synthase family protein n=1 Tax=Oceanicella sp. SM1341 TaxID=1548889 RepID=UPI000E532311|nr:O-acetylhomoserine aminocarboxypropyltransferase/cysteine synthase family protein [Oceanicella sp. SM1341]
MTDAPHSYGFDTLQVHGGAKPDPATGARQTPIYQTTAYVFRDADHAAALFNLQEVGFIYSRLTNPTVSALQERIASLEGGVGAVATSSGHAAQILALFPLMGPGDNIVSSNRLYGGTITQFSHTIRRFGWEARFADTEDLAALEAACDERTKAIFCESICNPGGYVTDIPALAEIAQRKGIPLIVDNTTATPYLCNPIAMGATLVVHSTTKYLSGNGSAMGGVVVDSGKFDWSASGRFPSLSAPEPAYHGLKFHETFGPLAFVLHGHAVGLRDLGMCQSPMNAWITLQGIETLSMRMEKHVANAKAVAEWLEADPRVARVTWPGLASSPWHARAEALYPKGAGALFTFGVKGGYEACVKLVDAVEIFSHVANLGDTRSLIIHPASTTHRQLDPGQQEAAGAAPDMVRLSIGIESAADLIADLDQALAAATA